MTGVCKKILSNIRYEVIFQFSIYIMQFMQRTLKRFDIIEIILLKHEELKNIYSDTTVSFGKK
jgi:hypothetical protein